MGLKRVSWVRRYQGQCRALRPLGHQGYRVRNYKKDPPLCSGYMQLLAQRGCKVRGEHEEQGLLGVAQPGQVVVVYRPPSFEVRHGELGGPVLWGVPSDGGRVVSP